LGHFGNKTSSADTIFPQSLRIVPEITSVDSFSHVSQTTSAPSAPGLYDVLRNGIGPAPVGSTTTTTASGINANVPTPVDSTHPLEARLRDWERTQQALRQQMLRRNFGKAAALRRDLELRNVREGEWRPAALFGRDTSVHEDVLLGRDDTITWEDVFVGHETRPILGLHEEMERKLGI